MTALYPLLMDPVLVPKPWGGRRLERYGKALPEATDVGESWEVADLGADVTGTPGGAQSRVGNGAYAGTPLDELVATAGADLLGTTAPAPGGRFPLLVKLLDAREPLSVQVHPDAAYAAAHPGTFEKTESWYVVEAEPGAMLYLGLQEGVGAAELEGACGSGAIEEVLATVPARPGDLHHLPAGTVHALGAGVLVAEVQTPSDTTFRLYDWGDRLGRAPRRMHVPEALVATHWDEESPPARRLPDGCASGVLVETAAYRLAEHRLEGAAMLEPAAGCRVVMCVAGRAAVAGVPLARGATALLPPGPGAALEGTATLLEITPAGA